jgi:hypothetical protein
MVVVSLVALLGVVALTADGGLALAERRNAQAAADAAAWSAAADLFANWQANDGYDTGGTAARSAQTVAAVQGYSASDVTVNLPGGTYQAGPHQGETIPQGYVEVIINFSQPAYFSSIFGSGGATISARSVVRAQWVWAPPIVVLAPGNYPGALYLGGGSNNVSVPNGAVYVNSSDPQAMKEIPSATMTAPNYSVVGGATDGFNPSSAVHTGTHAISDPLQYIPAIDPGALTLQARPVSVTGTYNLQPGRYVNGLFFSGSDSVNMAPGIYYMDGGGFTFMPSGATPGTLNAPSVMIYNGGASPGSVYIQGTGQVTLGPLPASFGLAQAITIFQDRSLPDQLDLPIWIKHIGTAKPWNIKGVIYGANAPVVITNQGGDPSFGEQYICYSLNMYLNGDTVVPGNLVKTRSIGGVE